MIETEEYERGFNDGFAAAIHRTSRKAPMFPSFKEGPRKKLSISFSEEEFSKIEVTAKQKGVSLGAAVREMMSLWA